MVDYYGAKSTFIIVSNTCLHTAPGVLETLSFILLLHQQNGKSTQKEAKREYINLQIQSLSTRSQVMMVTITEFAGEMLEDRK